MILKVVLLLADKGLGKSIPYFNSFTFIALAYGGLQLPRVGLKNA